MENLQKDTSFPQPPPTGRNPGASDTARSNCFAAAVECWRENHVVGRITPWRHSPSAGGYARR